MYWCRRRHARRTLASSIQYGAKSPEKAVTNTHPPLSSTVAANSEIFSLCVMKPILFIRNFTPSEASKSVGSQQNNPKCLRLTAARYRNATFQSIYRLPFSTKVIRNRCEQAMLRNDRFLAYVVEQEASSSVRVLRVTRRKALHPLACKIVHSVPISHTLLSDQCCRLISKTSRYALSYKRSRRHLSICFCVRRWYDSG